MNEKKPKIQKEPTKEALLADIEKLMQHDKSDKETINPELLDYLDIESLTSIKKSLLERVGKLSDEDIAWLQQFKKYG